MENTLGFKPFQPPLFIQVPIQSALLQLVRSPLNLREQDSGSIYLYAATKSGKRLGYVKIGVTTREPEERKSQLSRCKGKDFDLDEVSLGDKDSDSVKHVYRVEKLIHMELKEARRKRACKASTKSEADHNYHGEWFQVDADQAKKICLKWIDWIRKKPYESFRNDQRIWILNTSKISDSLCESSIETMVSESQADDIKKPTLLRRLTGQIKSKR